MFKEERGSVAVAVLLLVLVCGLFGIWENQDAAKREEARRVLDSWVGESVITLYEVIGPPNEIIPAGDALIAIYRYDTTATSQGRAYQIGNILHYDPPTTRHVERYVAFWIDSQGVITKWQAKGLGI